MKPFTTQDKAIQAGETALVKRPYFVVPTKYGRWITAFVNPNQTIVFKGNSGSHRCTDPEDSFCESFFSEENRKVIRSQMYWLQK